MKQLESSVCRLKAAVLASCLCVAMGSEALSASEEIPPDKAIHPLIGSLISPVLVPGGRKDPVFPEQWRSAHVGALMIVQAEIDKRGIVKRIEELDTQLRVDNGCWKDVPGAEGGESGKPLNPFEASRDFESAAVRAVKTWKFTPATTNGMPVAVYHSLIIDFSPCPSGVAESQPTTPPFGRHPLVDQSYESWGQALRFEVNPCVHDRPPRAPRPVSTPGPPAPEPSGSATIRLSTGNPFWSFSPDAPSRGWK